MSQPSIPPGPSSRGRGRGHGQASRGGRRQPSQSQGSKPSWKLPPRRDFVDGLVPTPVQILHPPECSPGMITQIENLEYVGSYSWADEDSPTIIVPGPPRWRNRPLPFTLRPDRGARFKDQNSFRMPSSVLLPLMKAVDIVGKEIDWPAIDFVTDRNGLMKLMEWIEKGPRCSTFRIDMELVGERTVLFNRFETNTKDIARGNTFGFIFEREATVPAPGCERATGHRRIVKYDFYGLKMMVRFEVDAYIAGDHGAGSENLTTTATENLADLLANVDIVSDTSPSPNLRIIRGGSEVPQDSIMTMETRSTKNDRYRWPDMYLKFYLSQTPWYFIGIHEDGKFITYRNHHVMGDGMAGRRRKVEKGLHRLGRALEMIQRVMVAHGTGKRLSLLCEDGVLGVYEWVSNASCLPEDVKRRFVSKAS
ncbi:hypothetical protein EWM64_g8787 [Hericium alpestre]|uniref:Decapping nuclease n=1 Tax=Hericium alpestre TaxID=135208 RepID=A0A4Y9ZKU4_9AGAM|nr:hypothetical protein EWM64_g8787 [Hericium alpestre]